WRERSGWVERVGVDDGARRALQEGRVTTVQADERHPGPRRDPGVVAQEAYHALAQLHERGRIVHERCEHARIPRGGEEHGASPAEGDGAGDARLIARAVEQDLLDALLAQRVEQVLRRAALPREVHDGRGAVAAAGDLGEARERLGPMAGEEIVEAEGG